MESEVFFRGKKKVSKKLFFEWFFLKKGLKESLFRHFTALECVFMYTPIHIYMYSRPHDQQQWKLDFPNCVHSADVIQKVAIFASKYSYTNICVQKQQLSFAGFSTIKLPLSHHKNRFNPDICNFIADYGVKSCFYICLRLLLSINQWIVHIEIGIRNLHGCNHHGFVLVGEAILQAGFIGRNKRVVLF